MDADGNVGVGRRIASGLNLSIRQDGRIMNLPWSNVNNNGNDVNNNGNDSRGKENNSVVVPVSPPVAVIETACSGQNGTGSENCTEAQAVTSKDVTVCSKLADREARNTCITTWCSTLRDFSSCSRFSDNDDRLLCMYKCSPNQMK